MGKSTLIEVRISSQAHNRKVDWKHQDLSWEACLRHFWRCGWTRLNFSTFVASIKKRFLIKGPFQPNFLHKMWYKHKDYAEFTVGVCRTPQNCWMKGNKRRGCKTVKGRITRQAQYDMIDPLSEIRCEEYQVQKHTPLREQHENAPLKSSRKMRWVFNMRICKPSILRCPIAHPDMKNTTTLAQINNRTRLSIQKRSSRQTERNGDICPILR